MMSDIRIKAEMGYNVEMVVFFVGFFCGDKQSGDCWELGGGVCGEFEFGIAQLKIYWKLFVCCILCFVAIACSLV